MMANVRKLSGWGLSLLVILGLHVAVGLWMMFWTVKAQPLELPPAAMMIELEPLPAPTPAPTPPPVQAPEPEPEPQPKVVEAPKPQIALPPKPKPKPKPQPPKPKPPEPKPVKPQESESVKENVAPANDKPSESKPAAPQLAAPSVPSAAERTWQSELFNHLARYKRYPEDARRRGIKGTNRLRFVVDANGMVLSYSLVDKAGSASLDRATLQTIRRAQPLPKPPAELLKNGTLEIVAPFSYSLERR
ncbi:energy transducer TonB [Pseudomonas sp. 8Z]|uniref:energy transducer TonB n=1 Tax=Pseudomonas sp. 8Z TaxID=2653166 RepID=UPI003557B05A